MFKPVSRDCEAISLTSQYADGQNDILYTTWTCESLCQQHNK